jgi:hypothetical protein
VDLIPANSTHLWNADGMEISPLPGITPLEALNQEVIAIDSLTLEQYHKICHWDLSRRNIHCSTSATANPNSIIVCPSGDQLEDFVEIALLRDGELYMSDWRTPERVTGEVMKGGWTRYHNFILAAW